MRSHSPEVSFSLEGTGQEGQGRGGKATATENPSRGWSRWLPPSTDRQEPPLHSLESVGAVNLIHSLRFPGDISLPSLELLKLRHPRLMNAFIVALGRPLLEAEHQAGMQREGGHVIIKFSTKWIPRNPEMFADVD